MTFMPQYVSKQRRWDSTHLSPECGHVWRRGLMTVLIALSGQIPASALDWTRVNDRVQDKLVKVYGAGGVRGLEAYQSGFLISPTGHILTAWSYVLDTDEVTAVLYDGRRLTAQMVGADPRLEIAVLKVEANGLAFFDLQTAVELQVGDRVLAFSNLYGIASGAESSSLLQGTVSAITSLSARRGTFRSTYDGNIYVVDAMTNNAGAAGGALTDHRGQLAGMLGKELRSAQSNVWLNYALPIHELREAVQGILEGKISPTEATARRPAVDPVTLAGLGIVLMPNVLAKTPPYVQRVQPGSPAARAGLLSDDLIVMVGATVVQSCQEVEAEFTLLDRLDPVQLTVLRDQELLPMEMVTDALSDAAPRRKLPYPPNDEDSRR